MKKSRVSLRNVIIVGGMLFFIVGLAGCSTCANSAGGAVTGFAAGFAKGAKEDAQAIPSWDDWFRENFW